MYKYHTTDDTVLSLPIKINEKCKKYNYVALEDNKLVKVNLQNSILLSDKSYVNVFGLEDTIKHSSSYNCFRIPSIKKLNNGFLVALCEARKPCADTGCISIVYKISKNKGDKWGNLYEAVTIKDISPAPAYLGNPSPIIDNSNNIHLHFNTANTGFWYSLGKWNSSSNNWTWESPINLTNKFINDLSLNSTIEWAAYGFGGINIDNKLITMGLVRSNNKSILYSIYSNDKWNIESSNNWQNWDISGKIDCGQEPSITYNEKEKKYITITRGASGAYDTSSYRLTYNNSINGVISDCNYITDIYTPNCQASILSYNNIQYISTPINKNCPPEGQSCPRKDMTIYYNNTTSLEISNNLLVQFPSKLNEVHMYSSLELIDTSNIGLLYEITKKSSIHTSHIIAFRKINTV